MWLPLGERWGISPDAFRGRTCLMRKIAIEKLVCDLSLYPRIEIDQTHVEQMRAAMRSGATFPPIVICIKTRKVVDGFHRVRAYGDEYGEDHEAEVVEKEYPSIKEMFLDAIRYNAAHGKSMEMLDRAHAVKRAVELGIDEKSIARSMHVDTQEFCRLSVVPVPRRGNGAQLEVATKPVSAIEQRINATRQHRERSEAQRQKIKSHGHVSESTRRDIGHAQPEPERFEKVSSTVVLDRANASDIPAQKPHKSKEANLLEQLVWLFENGKVLPTDNDAVAAVAKLEELIGQFMFTVPD